MKTIAISEKTFQLLRRMKEGRNAKTFEETVIDLIKDKEKIPSSLFGSLKGKTKNFDTKERGDLWKDKER